MPSQGEIVLFVPYGVSDSGIDIWEDHTTFWLPDQFHLGSLLRYQILAWIQVMYRLIRHRKTVIDLSIFLELYSVSTKNLSNFLATMLNLFI